LIEHLWAIAHETTPAAMVPDCRKEGKTVGDRMEKATTLVERPKKKEKKTKKKKKQTKRRS